MATTFSANLRLEKPSNSDRGWDVPLNATIDQLDAFTPIGALAVTETETPSTTLNVRVTAGTYQQSNGQIATYAGANPVAIAASSTVKLWLSDAGTLMSGSSFPATPHVRLATVTSLTSTISTIVDSRLAGASCGASRLASTSTVTATYTVLPTDEMIRADATSGAFTITLPAASSGPFQAIRIIKVDNVATVTIASSSTIDGVSSLATQFASKTYVADVTSNTWNAF